ncbi:hypothetical protein BJ165DRAFT_1353096 [Panaeolus papilionaceus]|nr:hypothetical protein BJ165DRAFT_1353096 [Panaeolus papilionaceus]
MWAAESKLLEEKEVRVPSERREPADKGNADSILQLKVNSRLQVHGTSQVSDIDNHDSEVTKIEEAPTPVRTDNLTRPSRSSDPEVETLKSQIREVARVCKAISEGDFTQSISIDVQDPDDVMLQIKQVVNAMTTTLGHFSGEITRVTREIGTDGNLGSENIVSDSHGSWLEMTTGINTMSSNLRSQIRSMALVTKALLLGDLSKNIEVEAAGEVLQLKNTVNQLVLQQRHLVSEINRVTTHSGVEGMLGEQAFVPNLLGVWSDIVTNVNMMAFTFTNCIRSVAEVTKAIAGGDFSNRVQMESRGEVLELQETINGLAEFLDIYTNEVARVVRAVGVNGRMGEQARVRYAGGQWKVVMDGTNEMVNKARPSITLVIRCIAVVVIAVARGDLTQKISGVDVSGEILMLLTTINDMVEELEGFAHGMKRAARGVGVDGSKALRGTVSSVIGIWQELR